MSMDVSKESGSERSLQFYQLIGGPLTALVQAEAQAAQVTAEFIERIGFEPLPAAVSPQDGSAQAAQPLRRLRMLTFHYDKVDKAGKRQTYQVQLPLLSLIPIPAIQIKAAEIELMANIRGIKKARSNTQLGDESKDFLSRERLELKMGMRGSKSASAMQVKVKLNVEQADLPSGLSRLLHTLDESALNEPAKAPAAPSET